MVRGKIEPRTLDVGALEFLSKNIGQDAPPKRSHDYLREVEIRRFEGCTVNFQLLDYLTKTAVKREKLIISPLTSMEQRARKYNRLEAKLPLVLL
ncbi:hypothetical protein C1H46_003466 [Malus baccata]|uniref:FBD domain-containing protein n=1 Tax=Malus baccata TaxID=106549 RepID=A0A540NJT8_MALBA|nr:hypothetical protein C1H46_003466 [Malus baccata]